jgi:hypothetical protein
VLCRRLREFISLGVTPKFGICETRGVVAMLGIPLRCLVPGGSRDCRDCISVDEIAFGSTRNVPAYAMTGEAAAVPPRAAGIMPSAVKVTEIQNRLRAFGITLGSPMAEAWLSQAFHNAPGFSRTVSESNIGSEGITRTARAARQKKEQRSWKAALPRCGRA